MADTADDVDDRIDELIAGPASATVDGRSATAHKLSDLMEIRNDRAAQAASGTGKLGLRIVQLIPPGCG